MNLPPINLPKIPIPFEIPQMMHPCVVHFAIALPVVVLLLEIINLIVKKRAIGVVSFLLALLASATAIAAFMTGNVDANLANMDSVIQAHKNLGAYVVVLSMVVVIFKLFSVMIRTGIVKALYLMILIAFVGFVANEAMSGKELVYKDGVNVSNIAKLKTLNKNLNVEINGFKVANKQKVQQVQDLNTTVKSLQEQIKQLNIKIQSQDKEIEELNSKKSDTTMDIAPVAKDINSSSVESNQTNDSNITII
jgi:uncharacterized membrane protein